MYIKKKMRTKIILVAIVVLGFLYWRGMKTVATEKGLDCKFTGVYVCTSTKKDAKAPGFFEIIKAGARF